MVDICTCCGRVGRLTTVYHPHRLCPECLADPRKWVVPKVERTTGGDALPFLFFCVCCVVAALIWRWGN